MIAGIQQILPGVCALCGRRTKRTWLVSFGDDETVRLCRRHAPVVIEAHAKTAQASVTDNGDKTVLVTDGQND